MTNVVLEKEMKQELRWFDQMNECHDNIPSVYNQIHTSGTKS